MLLELEVHESGGMLEHEVHRVHEIRGRSDHLLLGDQEFFGRSIIGLRGGSKQSILCLCVSKSVDCSGRIGCIESISFGRRVPVLHYLAIDSGIFPLAGTCLLDIYAVENGRLVCLGIHISLPFVAIDVKNVVDCKIRHGSLGKVVGPGTHGDGGAFAGCLHIVGPAAGDGCEGNRCYDKNVTFHNLNNC